MIHIQSIVPYCQGFWTGLAGEGTECCKYKTFSRERAAWIDGLDDGCIERLRHEDALKLAAKPNQPRKVLRLKPKRKSGERYVDMRLRQIASEG